MFIREIKENDDPMDVSKDWAAYKRQLRREREQRMSVGIVAVGLAAGLALLVCCLVAKARESAKERKALVELIGGVK
jgi:hypothetical protein